MIYQPPCKGHGTCAFYRAAVNTNYSFRLITTLISNSQLFQKPHDSRPAKGAGKGGAMNMDSKEICEYLKISRTTLWRLRKEEGLPSLNLGKGCRKVLFNKEQVDEWLRREK